MSPVKSREKRRRKKPSAKGSLTFPGHAVPLTESNLVKHNSRKSHRLKIPSQDSKISNPRPDRKDKVCIKNVRSNEEKALREKPRSTRSKAVVHDDSDAKATIASSNRVLAGTWSDGPKRRSRRRLPSKDNGQDSGPGTRHTEGEPAERKPLSELRIKDGNLDSGHPPSLPAGLTPDRGDRVTRESVESAKRRLIFPGLEALKQAQKQVRQARDCRELTHRKSMASDGNFFGIESSHKIPDHTSVIPTSKNLKVPQRRPRRNEDNANTFEKTVHVADASSCTIDTSDRLLEDGTTATVPSKTSGDCGNEGGEATLTHASAKLLLFEYFEGKKGTKAHTRPSVRVRMMPSNEDGVEIERKNVQDSMPEYDQKPLQTKFIAIGPRPSRERQSIKRATNRRSSSPEETEDTRLAHWSHTCEDRNHCRDQDSDLPALDLTR